MERARRVIGSVAGQDVDERGGRATAQRAAPGEGISRRSLLGMPPALVAAALFPPPRAWAASVLDPWLEEQVHADGDLREPTRVGELTRPQHDRMWQVFEWLGAVLELGVESRRAIGPGRLRWLLDLKTTREPSYLTEYVETLAALRHAHAAVGDDALPLLFFNPLTDAATSRNGRLHRYVRYEFTMLHLMHGGYRRFGVDAFPGRMARSFTAPIPPYRTMQP